MDAGGHFCNRLKAHAFGSSDTGIQHGLPEDCGSRLISAVDAFASTHGAELVRKRGAIQLIEIHFESQP